MINKKISIECYRSHTQTLYVLLVEQNLNLQFVTEGKNPASTLYKFLKVKNVESQTIFLGVFRII